MNEKVTPAQRLISGEANLVLAPSGERFKMLGPEERALAESLVSITQTYGKFNEDGEGVWAGYDTPSENKVKDIGVKCANCALYEGNGVCKIVAQTVEDNGYCRLAAIYDGAVKSGKSE